ncbi:DUF6463 family protein [Hymenobacter saemangeumensis]
MKLWKKSGTLLIATGIIHNAVGLLAGWPVLASMAAAGFVNTIGPGTAEMDRNAIFWFLFSGFLMLLLGKMMQDAIKLRQQPVPAYLGYCLLLLSVAGCLIMPASGFWLVLPQAVLIIYANRKARPAVAEGMAA